MLAATAVLGQAIEATITINSKKPEMIKVEGRFTTNAGNPNRRNLSFLQSVAGTKDLAKRISDLRLFDAAGNVVAFKMLSDGEYLSATEFERWTYTIDIRPQKNRSDAAHVSWFLNNTGIVMLADLLPRDATKSKRSARLFFKTPVDGSLTLQPSSFVLSSEVRREDGHFDVSDIEDAIFYFGSDWESGFSLTRPNSKVGVYVACCAWNFDVADPSEMASDIYLSYERSLGSRPAGPPFIAIAKFPVQTGFGEWEAETRGNSVTIISSDMPFKTQSQQRLHEQLRHELFHLWIPNGVNLSGNYDWFYEGFALYESLKLAVRLNRIQFADFLDTLSRAHTIDSAQSQRISLLQASANRFSGSNTQVYARGMLVAFLTDLTMLENSKGKRSVEDLLKDLYVKYRKPAAPADGNTAVIELLKSGGNATRIVEKYITGTDKIEWTNELSAAGIEDADPGVLTTLRAKEKLSGRQKAMLDKLGYNNWRKLSVPSK
jgi:hypothetical protein